MSPLALTTQLMEIAAAIIVAPLFLAVASVVHVRALFAGSGPLRT